MTDFYRFAEFSQYWPVLKDTVERNEHNLYKHSPCYRTKGPRGGAGSDPTAPMSLTLVLMLNPNSHDVKRHIKDTHPAWIVPSYNQRQLDLGAELELSSSKVRISPGLHLNISHIGQTGTVCAY